MSTGHRKSHVTIHLYTTTIVHSLLLFLELSHFLANASTLWNRTITVFALLGMESKQGPYPLANAASPVDFRLADLRMLQILLHFRAIGRAAITRSTPRRVLNKLDMKHDISLALFSLLFCEAASVLISIRIDSDRHQFVRAFPPVSSWI